MGSSGLGSTSSQLYSGGGGGDNDFNLVLHEVSPPGSHVKKGNVVAEFDRQYMLLRLEDFKDAVTQNASSLKSQTAEIRAQKEAHDQLVASAKADVDKAELDMKTIPVLSRIDAERTKMALEQARAKYKQLLSETALVNASNQASLNESQLAFQQSQLELQRAQNNVDKMLVHAPMNGTVVMESIWRSGDRGQVKKGDQLRPGTRYMRIVDPSQMRVNAVVNQADVAFLRVGQKARVTFDAYPGLTLDAHVESVPPATNTGFFRADYVRTVPVRLRLDQSDPRVIPDLSVGIDVEVSQATDSVIIERAAVFGGRSGAEHSSPHVFVESGNTWITRPIRVGMQNNVSAVVVDGVQPGDVVALDTPPGVQGQT
jgi:multidrug resistance efflux pump